MKIEELINQYYHVLTENDQYICQCILNHMNDCIQLSIEEFAKKYHVSTSSLSRFAQRLSLPGYSELRAILRLDNERLENPSQSLENMKLCYEKVINDLQEKDCTVLFKKMSNAKRIIVFGEGYAQGRVAKEMKRMFLPSQKKIYDVYGIDMLSSLTQFVQAEDIVFIISLDGETNEVIEFARALFMKGIYTISITKMLSNTLSHLCQEKLYIQSLDISINEIKQSITTPYFILLELLYVKYKMYIKNEHIPSI